MKRLIWILLVGSAFAQLYPYVPPAPTSGGGSIAHVNNDLLANNSSSGTTYNAVPPNSVTSGHLEWIEVFSTGTGAPTIGASTRCSSWTADANIVGIHITSGSEVGYITLWTCIAGSSGSESIPIGSLINGDAVYVAFMEFSGIASATANVSNATISTNYGTSYTAGGSITTTQAATVVIAPFVGNTGTFTPESGYTLSTGTATGNSVNAEWKVMSSTGTYTPTLSVAAGGWGTLFDAAYH